MATQEKSRGEAADYYNQGPPPQQYQQGPPPQQYQQGPPPQQYQQQQYDVENQQQFGQPPPYQNPQKNYQPGDNFQFNEAFKVEKPKWNDLWAGILLILVFGGFVAVSGLTLNGYSNTKGTNGNGIYGAPNTFGLSTNTVILFAFVVGFASILSYIYVWLARLFPKGFIWITGILNIIFQLVLGIYMISRKSYGGGIVFLVFGVLTIFFFFTWIPSIPFSAFMLKTSIGVSKKYGHTYMVSLIGGLLAAAFGAWYSITLVAIYSKYQPGDQNPNCSSGGCSKGKVIGLVAFITFAMYWISEWLKNTIHTVIAGVYGSWFYWSTKNPKGATRGALKRALTYSFGSISFGSLIVAIINCLRQLCSIAQADAANDGNIAMVIAFCVLRCILCVVDWAVEFINRYAFVTIALFGKSYLKSAKDTWTFMKQRGIDALVNSCLIGPVLSMGAFFIGAASALLGYLYVLFTNPAYNRTGSFTPVIVGFSFVIGLQICNIFTTPLSSGIDTIFVASAWDPEVLARDHPDVYQEMLRVYPRLQEAIHA